MIKLADILVVALGFGLRLNPLVVVLSSGLATGFAAGLSLCEVGALIGRFFEESRAGRPCRSC